MDFNSLTSGSAFYILRIIDDKPTYAVGTVKSKINAKNKYINGQTAQIGIYNAANTLQVADFVVSFPGKGDEVFTEIPVMAEVANTDDNKNFFSTSQTAIANVLLNLINASKKALAPEEKKRHETMVQVGEEIYEQLNPKFAEEKKQAKTISDLEKGYGELKKSFGELKNDNAKILSMLAQLTNEKKSLKQ